MRTITSLLLFFVATTILADTTFEVSVENKSKNDRIDAPVTIALAEFNTNVKCATITLEGKEIPCQLDDLDGDDQMDELFFLADVKGHTTNHYKVTLSPNGTPNQYEQRVWAQLMIRSYVVKEENKQDLYLASMVVEKGIDPFMTVHQHGVSFENELGAYRVYFDPRQTIDLYGKFNKGLELKDTQFYPDKEQKSAGYGDDILWVGGTFGLGALRGWDGEKPTMLDNVNKRGQSVISYGPLRAIVTMSDRGWIPQPSDQPIDMVETYTIYGGNRVCDVDVKFNRPAKDYAFSTGMVNVKGSTEYSDHKGLRACWGTDWPAGEPKGTEGPDYKKETVGLGIYVPVEYLSEEKIANADDYTLVLKTSTDQLHYKIMFSSDNESFGYHSAEEWFNFLKEWREELDYPLEVEIHK